jgi:predicted transcriptional regulator
MLPEMTKSEREVMRLLWDSTEPLSCMEIVSASPNKHWKDSYIHVLVTGLMKKGYIRIAAFEQVSRVYARKFAPTMDYGQFVLQQVFTPEQLDDREYMIGIWRKLIMSVEDVEVINKIEQIIQETKHKRKAKAE